MPASAHVTRNMPNNKRIPSVSRAGSVSRVTDNVAQKQHLLWSRSKSILGQFTLPYLLVVSFTLLRAMDARAMAVAADTSVEISSACRTH